MTESRKNLKIMSWLVLVFTVWTLVKAVVEVFSGFNAETAPDGVSDGLVLVAKIVLIVFSVVLLLPQVYVGVKGLKLAKEPVPGKAHIIWAAILLAVTVLGTLPALVALVQSEGVKENWATLSTNLAEGLVFLEYIRKAREVAKEI